MAAPVVPEIPVLAYMAIGLLALVSWLVLRGLLGAYRMTFGYVLERLAGLLHFHKAFIHVDFGGPIRALDNGIQHTMSAGAAKSEHAAGYLFHGAAVIQEWSTRELLHLASETAATLEWALRGHLPKVIKVVAQAAIPPLLIARLVRQAIAAELPKLTKLVHGATTTIETTITHKTTIPYLHDWQWLHRHWRALQHAIAAAAATAGALTLPHVHIFPRLGALERRIGSIHKRLGRLEKLLGVTGLAIAMAHVLGLPNWRCLTRGNIGRTARALCGLDSALLTAILAGIALIETPLSIEELARDFLAIEDELVAIVTGAISELDGLG